MTWETTIILAVGPREGEGMTVYVGMVTSNYSADDSPLG